MTRDRTVTLTPAEAEIVREALEYLASDLHPESAGGTTTAFAKRFARARLIAVVAKIKGRSPA